MAHKSWYDDHDEFMNKTVPKLQRIGKDMGEKAKAGDQVCQDAMKHYGMLLDSFDPMTHHLLKEDIQKYESSMARTD